MGTVASASAEPAPVASSEPTPLATSAPAASEPLNRPAVLDLAAPRSQVLAALAAGSNPTLPNKCGLNMAVVLDLSNSLSNADVTASKSAAKSVVDTLSGTPSAFGVYTFGTFAPDGTNASIPKTSVSTANGAASVNTKIGNVNRVPESVGGTNWDAALRNIPRPGYDAVLFDNIDLSRAVTAADALKTSGTFAMGLGVGSSVNSSNIQAISGINTGTDYFQISDYAKLTAKLKEIALKNCQGTVSIVKQVRELDGTLAPATGWTFNGRTADNVSPSNAVTGADGAVNLKINDLQAAGRTVQFSELQQAGHVLESQNGRNAVCVNNTTGTNVSTTNAGGLGFALAVNPADAISCQVTNAKISAQLKVTKTWINAVAGDKASFTANDKTGTSTASTNGDVMTATFAQGTTVNVAEALASANNGSYATTLKCTNAAGTPLAEGALSGSFVLGASNVTCAFTNTNTAATVVVAKKWIVDGTAYDNGNQPAGISAALTLTGPDSAGANSYTITNTVECTTQLTLLKVIETGNGGSLVPGDFTLTAQPGSGVALVVAGANTLTPANTKAVTAGTSYQLSELGGSKTAYLRLGLQRYTGALNPDGSLADPDAWADATSTTVTVTTGRHAIYRFVNASAPALALPLTGGTGSSPYLTAGGGRLLLAALTAAGVAGKRIRAKRR